MSEDPPFTPRLGRIGDQGQPAGRRGGAAINRSLSGARIGEGRAAHTRGRPSGRTARALRRRVIVSVHIARAGKAGPGLYRAHLGYLQRDGVSPDGQGGVPYGRQTDRADVTGFVERSEHDRHQFRIIVSPEDGAELGDLKTFTRALMARMEHDLDKRLDWVAVDHHNTGHPHTHIVIRGKDARQRDLVIARAYLTRGLREAAEDLLTNQLGPRRALDIAAARAREVNADRWTSLDQELDAVRVGRAINLPRSDRVTARFDRALHTARLQHLETLGLAHKVPEGGWTLTEGWQDTLRQAGRKGDIIATLTARHTAEREQLRFAQDLSPDAPPILGTIAAYGPEDELRDTRFLRVEAFDGELWHVPAGVVDMSAPPAPGAVVELTRAPPSARPADQAIAAIARATDGLWSEDLHASHDPGSSAAYRLSLKRRLEALRRAGIGERLPDGRWSIPEDFVDRATQHEARRTHGVRVAVLSWVPADQQVSLTGETWLDRSRPEPGTGPGSETGSESGRLADLRTRRRAWLQAKGLLEPDQAHLRPDQRARLRALELSRAEATLAARTGRVALRLTAGDRLSGRLEGHLDLASGRMAIIGTPTQVALVPWRDTLARQIGRDLSVQRSAAGLSWTPGPSRSELPPF